MKILKDIILKINNLLRFLNLKKKKKKQKINKKKQNQKQKQRRKKISIVPERQNMNKMKNLE